MEFINNIHIYIYNEFGFNNASSFNSLGIFNDFLKVKHNNGIVDEQPVSLIIRATMNAYITMNLEVHFTNSDKVIDYHTLLQKDLHFNQHIINTEQKFDEIFEKFEGLKNHLFRGLSEAKYPLYSKHQREWIN